MPKKVIKKQTKRKNDPILTQLIVHFCTLIYTVFLKPKQLINYVYHAIH